MRYNIERVFTLIKVAIDCIEKVNIVSKLVFLRGFFAPPFVIIARVNFCELSVRSVTNGMLPQH